MKLMQSGHQTPTRTSRRRARTDQIIRVILLCLDVRLLLHLSGHQEADRFFLGRAAVSTLTDIDQGYAACSTSQLASRCLHSISISITLLTIHFDQGYAKCSTHRWCSIEKLYRLFCLKVALLSKPLVGKPFTSRSQSSALLDSGRCRVSRSSCRNELKVAAPRCWTQHSRDAHSTAAAGLIVRSGAQSSNSNVDIALLSCRGLPRRGIPDTTNVSGRRDSRPRPEWSLSYVRRLNLRTSEVS